MKRINVIAVWFVGLILLSFTSCAFEDTVSNMQKEIGNGDDIVSDVPEGEDTEESATEELSFVYTDYYYKSDINVDMVFMYTKEDLESFCNINGEKIGDKFMQDIAKYDDAFFEKNTLLFWCYDLISTNESELLSIEHAVTPSDRYIINLKDKINLGGNPGWIVGYSSWLIEIAGRHAITVENTVVNITQETFFPD